MVSNIKGEIWSLFLSYFSQYGNSPANQIENGEQNLQWWVLVLAHTTEGTLGARVTVEANDVLCKKLNDSAEPPKRSGFLGPLKGTPRPTTIACTLRLLCERPWME